MGNSIKDIALALDLSKTTVSWILSGKGEARGFNENTIKRVKRYAEEINYRPNLLARSLSLGTTNTIGLIVPSIGDTFYAQIAQAIEREAEKHKSVLTICSSEGDNERELHLIHTLRAKQVDGLIIAPTKKTQIGINELLHDSFPFVLVDRYFPELNTNYIIVDNETTSYKLVKCLAEKGCKKIAFVAADMHLLVMKRRSEGYKRALEEADIAFDSSLCLQISRINYKDDTLKNLDQLFKQHADVDAFYFATHYLALEAIRYFIDKRIDYHCLFKMACFHDTIALDILAPEMLISRMPIEEMGAKAVDILIQHIKQPSMNAQGFVLENTLYGVD